MTVDELPRVTEEAPDRYPWALARGRGPVAPAPAVVERCAWSLVWLAVLGAGIGLWNSWSAWPGAIALAPVLVVGSVIGMASVWLAAEPGDRRLRRGALVAALAGAGLPSAAAIHARAYLSTDSAAFNQIAARVLAHGADPYTASMASAARLLDPSSSFWTYTVDGGHVTQVSYPAGSFLLEMPALLLGFHHDIADWTDLAAWLVTGVLLYALLPRAVRWLGPLVLLAPNYVGMFSNGGTDALYLPFLVLAVWRWDRFAVRDEPAGAHSWPRRAALDRFVGPVCLGLACAIKQTPWFCLPFLAFGVALEARRAGRGPWRTAGAYLAVVAAVFAVVNLPFALWGPAAWVHGTALPLIDPLVADGQGLVAIAVHGLTGGVDLTLLSLAGALVYLALLAAYVAWYPRLKRVWLFLLPAVLFVPSRSLSSYLIDLFPVAVVAALTVSAAGAPPRRTGPWRWPARLAVLAPLAGSLVAGVLAFTTVPLQLSVTGFAVSQGARRLDAVRLIVHNATAATVVPHFMVVVGGDRPSGYWRTTGTRPLALGPGRSASVTIRPGPFIWSPGRGGYWLVQAYTSRPDALSTSSLQRWPLGSPN